MTLTFFYPIKWDGGNRIQVRLDPSWRGKTVGLCGDFNLDQADDFRTTSGMVEASSRLFGDSWKMHNYCPQAEETKVGSIVVDGPA